jgi:hypothetical protein
MTCTAGKHLRFFGLRCDCEECSPARPYPNSPATIGRERLTVAREPAVCTCLDCRNAREDERIRAASFRRNTEQIDSLRTGAKEYNEALRAAEAMHASSGLATLSSGGRA